MQMNDARSPAGLPAADAPRDESDDARTEVSESEDEERNADYYRYFPQAYVADQAAELVRAELVDLRLGAEPCSFAELIARAPAFVAAIRQSQLDVPRAHLREFGPNEADLLEGDFARTPIWLVFLPGATAESLQRIAEKAGHSAWLCEWPNLWHKTVSHDIGSADYPIVVMENDFSNEWQYLEEPGAIVIGYANEACVAFRVSTVDTDQACAMYLNNHKPWREHSIRVLQCSARRGQASLARLEWQEHPGLIRVHSRSAPKPPIAGLSLERLLGARLALYPVEVEEGTLADLATFPGDAIELAEHRVTLLRCRSDAFAFLREQQAADRRYIVYCEEGKPRFYVMQIQGISEVLLLTRSLPDDVSLGWFLEYVVKQEVVAEHLYDGRLVTLPGVANDNVRVVELAGLGETSGVFSDAAEVLRCYGSVLLDLDATQFRGKTLYCGV